jgi:hypothetical protein
MGQPVRAGADRLHGVDPAAGRPGRGDRQPGPSRAAPPVYPAPRSAGRRVQLPPGRQPTAASQPAPVALPGTGAHRAHFPLRASGCRRVCGSDTIRLRKFVRLTHVR